MTWLPQGTLKNMTVRTMLITVVMSLPKTSQGRPWPIPIWSQPLGILTCSDTDEVVVTTTQKRFWKKVWASCSNAMGCLWSEVQLKSIRDSHQAIWESDHEIIQVEWEIALKGDQTSFNANKMTVRTDQLLHIKEATHSQIHIRDSETEDHGWKKTLMQSLKQFHVCFYQVYEKGTPWASL